MEAYEKETERDCICMDCVSLVIRKNMSKAKCIWTVSEDLPVSVFDEDAVPATLMVLPSFPIGGEFSRTQDISPADICK